MFLANKLRHGNLTFLWSMVYGPGPPLDNQVQNQSFKNNYFGIVPTLYTLLLYNYMDKIHSNVCN